MKENNVRFIENALSGAFYLFAILTRSKIKRTFSPFLFAHSCVERKRRGERKISGLMIDSIFLCAVSKEVFSVNSRNYDRCYVINKGDFRSVELSYTDIQAHSNI